MDSYFGSSNYNRLFHLVTSLHSVENLLKLPLQSASFTSRQPEYIVCRQITRSALWPFLISTLFCCAGVWGCIYFYLKNVLISNFDPNCLGGILLGAGVYFLTHCMNTDCRSRIEFRKFFLGGKDFRA